jgi:hypothetical protein
LVTRCTAGRGGHPMFWGVPHDIGAISIGKDEARVLRHEVGWHAFWTRSIIATSGLILATLVVKLAQHPDDRSARVTNHSCAYRRRGGNPSN